tara:strand:+ start:123 stop:413 length:291 start_codon:yes stop_codon:yes gene_type:complete
MDHDSPLVLDPYLPAYATRNAMLGSRRGLTAGKAGSALRASLRCAYKAAAVSLLLIGDKELDRERRGDWSTNPLRRKGMWYPSRYGVHWVIMVVSE